MDPVDPACDRACAIYNIASGIIAKVICCWRPFYLVPVVIVCQLGQGGVVFFVCFFKIHVVLLSSRLIGSCYLPSAAEKILFLPSLPSSCLKNSVRTRLMLRH